LSFVVGIRRALLVMRTLYQIHGPSRRAADESSRGRERRSEVALFRALHQNLYDPL
jgi:hypothetical protein